MKALLGLISAGVLILLCQHVHAGNTTPEEQVGIYISLSGMQPHVSRGYEFFTSKQEREWSCSSCHTNDPTSTGHHMKTGESILPMAPSANPDRFTDAKKTEKWFHRNCLDVIDRECTPEEKANVLAWLLSQKQ